MFHLDPHQDTDHPKAIDTYPHSENLQGDGVILKKRREAHLIEREAHHQERKEAHHQGTEGGVHLQEKGGVLPGKGGAHLLGNAGAHLQGDGIALLLVGGEVHLLGKGEAFLQGQLVVLHLEGGQAHMQENGLDHHLVHWTDGLDEEGTKYVYMVGVGNNLFKNNLYFLIILARQGFSFLFQLTFCNKSLLFIISDCLTLN